MNASFRLDGSTTLRIGNDLMLPTHYQALGYIALLVERERTNGPGEPQQPSEVSVLATLKPHEARAMASVLLSAATEARNTP